MTECSEHEEMLKAENVELMHRMKHLEEVNKELEEKLKQTAYTEQYVAGVFDVLRVMFGGAGK